MRLRPIRKWDIILLHAFPWGMACTFSSLSTIKALDSSWSLVYGMVHLHLIPFILFGVIDTGTLAWKIRTNTVFASTRNNLFFVFVVSSVVSASEVFAGFSSMLAEDKTYPDEIPKSFPFQMMATRFLKSVNLLFDDDSGLR